MYYMYYAPSPSDTYTRSAVLNAAWPGEMIGGLYTVHENKAARCLLREKCAEQILGMEPSLSVMRAWINGNIALLSPDETSL
jgi:hypothetical protein